jgi:hypothetical protein
MEVAFTCGISLASRIAWDFVATMNDTRGTVFRSVVTESQLAPTANALIHRKLLRQLQLLCPFALQGLLVSDLFGVTV